MSFKFKVDLQVLKNLNDIAIERQYNRALANEFFIPENRWDDLYLYPVMEHHHKGGVLTDDLHYRCIIDSNNSVVGMIDVPKYIIDDNIKGQDYAQL